MDERTRIFIDAALAERDQARKRQIASVEENAPGLIAIAENRLGTIEDSATLEAKIFNLRNELWSFGEETEDYLVCQTALNIGVLKAKDQFGITHGRVDEIFQEADDFFRKQNPKRKSIVDLT